MNTFYWFDYETWGISPQWDKPAQFAGIRTDEELNIIGTPDMFYCQLPPDYLPDPVACLVTGLKPDFVNEKGVIEPDFVRNVLKHLGEPNTCSVGYNSIRFDDEVTRYTCFRNFHDPYQYHWKNGNSRWDLLDVVRLTRALRPDGIQWPVNDDGSSSNKLEHLTTANNLEHENAHDALSDVYATIAIAKLIKQAQPKLYAYALTLRDKHTVAAALNYRTKKPVVHVSGMVPGSRSHASIVVPLAPHPTNSNGVIVLDMRTDPAALVDLNVDEIRSRIYAATNEPEKRIHLRTIQTNRCPMIAPMTVMTESDAARIGIERCVELDRASRVDMLTEDQLQIICDAMTYQESESSKIINEAIASYPEASLYSGGFLSANDRNRAEKITRQKPEQLIGFFESEGFFDDQRLTNLFTHYRARYAIDTLTPEEKQQWLDDSVERLNEDHSAPWRTFEAFDLAMHEAEDRWPNDTDELKNALLAWRETVEDYLSQAE